MKYLQLALLIMFISCKPAEITHKEKLPLVQYEYSSDDTASIETTVIFKYEGISIFKWAYKLQEMVKSTPKTTKTIREDGTTVYTTTGIHYRNSFPYFSGSGPNGGSGLSIMHDKNNIFKVRFTHTDTSKNLQIQDSFLVDLTKSQVTTSTKTPKLKLEIKAKKL